MSIEGDADETVMYTFGDTGPGSSTSSAPFPTSLSNIKKEAKKLCPGKRAYAYVHFLSEEVEYKAIKNSFQSRNEFVSTSGRETQRCEATRWSRT